jgi:uncharacterized protein YbcV (DUF1398 family)
MTDVAAIVKECAARSHAETIAFPEVVAKLTAAGVEQYHADLRRGETSYFLPDGRVLTERLHTPSGPIAGAFDPAGVEAAVRGAQRGELGYQGFLTRIMKAGCVRYFAYLQGRNVTYLGRCGEQHVEPFPAAT